MSELREGHIYHTIMYGLNAMGPRSSIITEDERWKIIMHVETLQGKKMNEAATEGEESTEPEMAEATN
jgi:hypothetical protein